MKVPVIVGVFFLVLAAVFGLAAWRDYIANESRRMPAGKARARIAIIFAIVGAGLVLWQIIG